MEFFFYFSRVLRWRLYHLVCIDEVRVEGLILDSGRRVRNMSSITETGRIDEETKQFKLGR